MSTQRHACLHCLTQDTLHATEAGRPLRHLCDSVCVCVCIAGVFADGAMSITLGTPSRHSLSLLAKSRETWAALPKRPAHLSKCLHALRGFMFTSWHVRAPHRRRLHGAHHRDVRRAGSIASCPAAARVPLLPRARRPLHGASASSALLACLSSSGEPSSVASRDLVAQYSL